MSHMSAGFVFKEALLGIIQRFLAELSLIDKLFNKDTIEKAQAFQAALHDDVWFIQEILPLTNQYYKEDISDLAKEIKGAIITHCGFTEAHIKAYQDRRVRAMATSSYAAQAGVSAVIDGSFCIDHLFKTIVEDKQHYGATLLTTLSLSKQLESSNKNAVPCPDKPKI